MESVSMFNDRRKTIRKKGLKEAFLVNPQGIHQILDISTGGLSFKCAVDEEFPRQWLVDVIVAGTLIYIKQLPVRFVRECDDNQATFISAPTKNVGVKFGDLDEDSISSLLEVLYLPTPLEEGEQWA